MGLKKFNAKKEIKKLKRRNSKLKKIGIIGILIGTIFIISSYALYSYTGSSLAFNSKVSKRIQVIIKAENGKIGNDTSKKVETDYEQTITEEVIPDEGYGYESVSCDNEITASYDKGTNTLTVKKPIKDTECRVKFEKLQKLKDAILAHNTLQNEISDFSKGEPVGEDCSQASTKDKTVSLLSTNRYFIGDSFEYSNYDNGLYTIKNGGIKVDNYIESSFTDNDIDKYICMGRSNPCTTMYKIKSISEDKPSIIKVDEYTSTCKSKSTGSGIYKAEDNQGESYYFRGDRNELNNNVSFANKEWKIVRINGDETIRLILNDKIDNNSQFNDYQWNTSTPKHEKVGFTMGNTKHQCTKDNPCEVTYDGSSFNNENFGGENSDIKTALETWYKSNLNSVNDKIATSYFCNDTSSPNYVYNPSSTSYVSYGAYDRVVTKKEPSLKCPEPKDQSGNIRPYGGIYKTKIGLITTDELNMAGLSFYDPLANETNYLYHDYSWWSLSPECSYNKAGIILGRIGSIVADTMESRSTYAVVPVINLKADAQVIGDGSEESPFIIN